MKTRIEVATVRSEPTQAETFRAIRALGLTAGLRDGEWRVSYPLWAVGKVQAEAIAYYTNDRQDAIETARFMATRLPGRVYRLNTLERTLCELADVSPELDRLLNGKA